MSEYEGITTPDPDAELATNKAQRELEDELHPSSIFGKFPVLVIDPNGPQRNLDMNPGRTWLYPDVGIAVTIPEEAVVLSEPNTRPWNKSQPGHISDQSEPAADGYDPDAELVEPFEGHDDDDDFEYGG
ncbi:MAG: hypothetical protein ACLQRH_16970 [Acidimicrobiales bacterium]|jgi:hypothetical protein